MVAQAERLAHDQVLPHGGARIVEQALEVLRSCRRDLHEGGLDRLAREAERVGALFLKLMLDRGDGVVRERGMLRVAHTLGLPCRARLVS